MARAGEGIGALEGEHGTHTVHTGSIVKANFACMLFRWHYGQLSIVPSAAAEGMGGDPLNTRMGTSAMTGAREGGETPRTTVKMIETNKLHFLAPNRDL